MGVGKRLHSEDLSPWVPVLRACMGLELQDESQDIGGAKPQCYREPRLMLFIGRKGRETEAMEV
jgi:hypothetical protein